MMGNLLSMFGAQTKTQFYKEQEDVGQEKEDELLQVQPAKPIPPKPSLLNHLHLRDVFSFLTYKELIQVRSVSARFDHAATHAPHTLLAKPHFLSLELYFQVPDVANNDESPYDDAGFLKVLREKSIPFRLLPEFRHCCPDLAVAAAALAGQRLVLNHAAEKAVCIVFTTGVYRSDIMLGVKNELSSTTAFVVLHLFEHLRSCNFDLVTYRETAFTAGPELEAGGVLNPKVMALLSAKKRYRIYVRWASNFDDQERAMPPFVAKTLHQFAKVRELHSTVDRLEQKDFDEMLGKGRRLAKQIFYWLRSEMGASFINRIHSFYTKELPNLRHAIAFAYFTFDVAIPLADMGDIALPKSFDVCHLTNVRSGEELSMQLLKKNPQDDDEIEAVSSFMVFVRR